MSGRWGTQRLHVIDEVLSTALRFAVRKRLAGTAGDVTTETLVAWVRAGGCPDSEWRGTVRELLWEMDADEFGGLLWHPELTPKQVGDFVRSTGAHLPVFPGFRVPNVALVDMLRLVLPDEDWPETPDDTDPEWRAESLAVGTGRSW